MNGWMKDERMDIQEDGWMDEAITGQQEGRKKGKEEETKHRFLHLILPPTV